MINLDSQYAEAYLARAKTHFVLDQIPKALEDVDTYLRLKPNTDRFLLEGSLYFSIQDFDTALLRLQKAHDSQQTLTLRVKAYICIG